MTLFLSQFPIFFFSSGRPYTSSISTTTAQKGLHPIPSVKPKDASVSPIRTKRIPIELKSHRHLPTTKAAAQDETIQENNDPSGSEEATLKEHRLAANSSGEKTADDVSLLRFETNKEMEESQSEFRKEVDFWGGVAEEIREIEWPAFNKVLGTTGVVLGVIIGSSAVLLTVNAVLAELSDRLFAGKGVQDFFG